MNARKEKEQKQEPRSGVTWYLTASSASAQVLRVLALVCKHAHTYTKTVAINVRSNGEQSLPIQFHATIKFVRSPSSLTAINQIISLIFISSKGEHKVCVCFASFVVGAGPFVFDCMQHARSVIHRFSSVDILTHQICMFGIRVSAALCCVSVCIV